MTHKSVSPTRQRPERHAMLPAIAAGLVSFGITLLIISGAYVQDLQLLSQVPGAVWQFVCGVPTDNEAVLPLLIGFAGITLLVGVALVAVHVWRRRSGSHTRTIEEG